MDYNKIKLEAKEKIKGHILELALPFLCIFAISFVVGFLTFMCFGDNKTASEIVSSILSIALLPVSFGINIYYLKFARNEKTDWKMVFDFYGKFLEIFILCFLIGLITGIGFILLIVPGVIACFALSMSLFIKYDDNLSAIDCMKKSNEMMMGYKVNYFVFILSFIGWMILGALTLGILYIWLIPYMCVSNALFYEEVRKNKAQ